MPRKARWCSAVSAARGSLHFTEELPGTLSCRICVLLASEPKSPYGSLHSGSLRLRWQAHLCTVGGLGGFGTQGLWLRFVGDESFPGTNRLGWMNISGAQGGARWAADTGPNIPLRTISAEPPAPLAPRMATHISAQRRAAPHIATHPVESSLARRTPKTLVNAHIMPHRTQYIGTCPPKRRTP